MNTNYIAVDNVFFQYNHSGIADLWNEVFSNWSKNSILASQIIILNRTSNPIPGFRNHFILSHKFSDFERDQTYLGVVCKYLGAHKLISTYYTTAAGIENYFMGYDCIPEITGLDLSRPEWVLKKFGIQFASKFIFISKNTKSDFERIYSIKQPAEVIYPGAPPSITSGNGSLDNLFSNEDPYKFLLCLPTPLDGYKNGSLLLKAISKRTNKSDYLIVCTRERPERFINTEYPGVRIIFPKLERSEYLNLISMSSALIYLSLYEGMGFPPLEALRIGCPVIANRIPVFEEIYGDSLNYLSSNSESSVNDLLDQLENNSLICKLPAINDELNYQNFSEILFKFITS